MHHSMNCGAVHDHKNWSSGSAFGAKHGEQRQILDLADKELRRELEGLQQEKSSLESQLQQLKEKVTNVASGAREKAPCHQWPPAWNTSSTLSRYQRCIKNVSRLLSRNEIFSIFKWSTGFEELGVRVYPLHQFADDRINASMSSYVLNAYQSLPESEQCYYPEYERLQTYIGAHKHAASNNYYVEMADAYILGDSKLAGLFGLPCNCKVLW